MATARAQERPETEEFGGPLFPDDAARRRRPRRRHRRAPPRASVPTTPGRCRTGPIRRPARSPRWRPPPPAGDDDDDDVDVWSTFTTESPVWRDDDPVTTVMDQVRADPTDQRSSPSAPAPPATRARRRPSRDRRRGDDLDRRPLGRHGRDRRDPTAADPRDRTGDVPPPRREPGRITIGTDPSGVPRRPPDPGRRRRARPASAAGRPAGPARTPARRRRATCRRRIDRRRRASPACSSSPLISRRCCVLVIIVVVLAIAGFEYFGKVTEKGYRPAVAAGPRRVRLPRRSPPTGSATRRCRSSSRSPSSPARSGSSAPAASSRARCRTWPSPRWASCGSACSARTPR